MAEGIAQKWLYEHACCDWLAISAGTCAVEGVTTSKETISALSQRGIEFTGTSMPLTKEIAQGATVVLCMSTRHLLAASQFSDAACLLDPSGDIADPIGQDQSVYDELADTLEHLIARKLQSLTQRGAT